MKSSFLKIGLFSLMLASVPMVFTGCKDYDDDINTLTEKDNNLQNQLSTLQAALDKCNAEVEAAKQAAQQSADDALKQAKAYADQAAAQAKADAISAVMEQVKALMGNVATVEDIDKLSTAIAAIDANLNKLSGRVDAAEAAIQSLQIQMAAVQAYKDLIEANQSAIEANKNDIASLQKAIEDIYNAIKAIQDSKPATEDSLASFKEEVNAMIEKLSKQIAAIQPGLVTLMNETLRSLVFIPNLYVDGVESVEYPYMPYSKLPLISTKGNYVNQANVACEVPAATADTKDQVAWNYNWANPQFVTSYNPVVNISYELNPATAVVKEDMLSFTATRDVEMISRGVNAQESHNLKVAPNSMKIENGNLTVGFTTRGDQIVSRPENDPNANGFEGSIFALQANLDKVDDKDVVVTSDYAMLYPAVVSIEAIGYPRSANSASYKNCPNGVNNLLWQTMQEAIEHAPSFEVQYDKGSINLEKVVDIHYAISTLTKNDGHHIWSYGEEAAYGLHYDFALVQYMVGPNNHTSDSRYATIDNNVFYPRTVDNQGNTINEVGIASVGREPIVRVRVLDESNNVVLVGFIKIVIVKNIDALVTNAFANSVNFKACDNVSVALTWSQVSRDILDLVSVTTKAEFDALYELDCDANGYAKQFTSTSKNAQAITTPYGVIGERVDPSNTEGVGSVTNVLVWSIPVGEEYYENGNSVACHGQQWIFEKEANNQKTIYVRYVSKVGDADNTAQPMIYLPWTITVNKPLSGGNISEKSLAWWFNDNADVYMNVPYPSNGGVPSLFARNQNDNWINAQPKFSSVTGYPANATNPLQPESYKFYFTGNQMSGLSAGTSSSNFNVKGAQCILGETVTPVNAANALKHLLYYNSGEYNNNCLYAGSTLIAVLDQTTGVITYEESAAAKDILNKLGAAHRDVANASSLKANVGIVNSTSCGYAIPMNNSIYDNYFLRPLTVTQNQVGEFVDAQANGSWVRIADLLSFMDWRKVNFVEGNNYTNAWLLAYYQVKGITVDIQNASATSNGQSGNFWSMFPNAQFEVRESLTSTTGVANNSISFNLSSYNDAANGTKAAYEAMANEMGYLFFQNTNGVVNQTTINVNITVEYYWGKLVLNGVTLVAKQTLGN